MNRVRIGGNYRHLSDRRTLLGVFVIYLPLLTTVPFVIIGVLLVRLHLWMVGASGVKGYWDFVPTWISHRYRNAEHIRIEEVGRWSLPRTRAFWIFNCKLYCPLSVALMAYAAYLVKIVENWWCPFAHDRKSTYAEGAIDMSFWHTLPDQRQRLHPDDRDNPIWNEASERPDS